MKELDIYNFEIDENKVYVLTRYPESISYLLVYNNFPDNESVTFVDLSNDIDIQKVVNPIDLIIADTKEKYKNSKFLEFDTMDEALEYYHELKKNKPTENNKEEPIHIIVTN